MTNPPTSIDAAHEAIKDAGFSVGEVAGAMGWMVCGDDGAGNEICGVGKTQGDAWRNAAAQAEPMPTIIVEP